MSRSNIRKVKLNNKVKLCVLISISIILTYLKISLPIFPSFLSFDLSDIPLLLGSFMFSPIYGVVGSLFKNILEILIKGSFTFGVGEFANFIIVSSFIFTSSFVYRTFKSNRRYIFSFFYGTISICLFGVLANYFFILPIYAKVLGININDIIAMGTEINRNINSLFTFLLFSIVPYNLIKSIIIWFPTIYIFNKLNKIQKP